MQSLEAYQNLHPSPRYIYDYCIILLIQCIYIYANIITHMHIRIYIYIYIQYRCTTYKYIYVCRPSSGFNKHYHRSSPEIEVMTGLRTFSDEVLGFVEPLPLHGGSNYRGCWKTICFHVTSIITYTA